MPPSRSRCRRRCTFRDVHALPVVFEEAEVAIIRDRYLSAQGAAKQVRRGLTWWKYSRFVRGLCRHAAMTTVVSEAERAILGDIGCDLGRVAVVPNGVDAGDLEWPRPAVAANRLIYPGSVTYSANLDAVSWFLGAILPIIHRTGPTSSSGSPGRSTARRYPASAAGRAPDADGTPPGRPPGHRRERGVRGAAAHRRRHAPQDPPGHGARHAGRLDLEGRRGPRRDAGPGHPDRRHAARRSPAHVVRCSPTRPARDDGGRGPRARAGSLHVDAERREARRSRPAGPLHMEGGPLMNVAGKNDRATPHVLFLSAIVFAITSLPYLYGWLAAAPDKVYTGLMYDVPDHAQVLVVGHRVARRAVHQQHDDAGAQPGGLHEPDDVGARPGPVRARPVVPGALPGVARDRDACTRLGAGGVSPGPRPGRRACERRRCGCRSPARGSAGCWCSRRPRCGLPDVPYPIDLYTTEPNTFWGLLAYPYIALAQGLLLLSVLLVWRAHRRPGVTACRWPASRRWPWLSCMRTTSSSSTPSSGPSASPCSSAIGGCRCRSSAPA